MGTTRWAATEGFSGVDFSTLIVDTMYLTERETVDQNRDHDNKLNSYPEKRKVIRSHCCFIQTKSKLSLDRPVKTSFKTH